MAGPFDSMISRVLGGLAFKKDEEKAWFKRRFAMFQDILEESWVYQEIGQGFLEKGFEQGVEKGIEKGREEGRLQEQRQILMNFLQVRFPETLALANQQTNTISNTEILRKLINKLFVVQTVEEVRQILLDINKQ